MYDVYAQCLEYTDLLLTGWFMYIFNFEKINMYYFVVCEPCFSISIKIWYKL